MIEYTANYTHSNSNFVIQNLERREVQSEMYPLLCIVKNLLQRGAPTMMSKYLQDQVGEIHKSGKYKTDFYFITDKTPIWHDTIKGDEVGQYNPAKMFFDYIPNILGDYSFVQRLILPEIAINDIIGVYNPQFANQQVDFYLPQAKLVIEIDGAQHDVSPQRELDKSRDSYLNKYGISTIRIKTDELRNGNYQYKIQLIVNRLERYKECLVPYQNALGKISNNSLTPEEVHDVLLPTAIIRFQILLLELLINGYIKIGEHWKFNIKTDEPLLEFARLAMEDVYIWLNNLVLLRDKHELSAFDYEILVRNSDDFEEENAAINIDFSLFQRYTDDNNLSPDVIFVRTDYFEYSESRINDGKGIGVDKNYFSVTTASSVNYNITDTDKPVLRFFLQNIFNKRDFRDGQFAIISNALNLRDTIGLLPTGGGKSICYQMPCLLQPSINFVVCPIKALMYDQIENLRHGDVMISNINLICGDQSAEERMQIMDDYSRGKYFIVWISPERFQIPSFRASLQIIINKYNVSYAVIDEVHCLSEWGHDFRTSYLNLARTIDMISPKDTAGEGQIKFIGLTATASPRVLKDIKIEFSRRKQQLEDENIKTLLDYTRPELDFYVKDATQRKWAMLTTTLNDEDIPNDKDKASIIFTPVVNGDYGCYQLSQNLLRHHPNQVAWYSGSCPETKIKVDGDEKSVPIMGEKEFEAHKREVQEGYKHDRYQILCATKAFGMGIDKPNIYYAIHYGLPSSVEALYQEAGRAGRWDKSIPENVNKRGKCYVLYSHESENNKAELDTIFSSNTSIDTIRGIIDRTGSKGQDIFTQLYLLSTNLEDVKKEYKIIIDIIDKFYLERASVDISYSQFQNKEFFLTAETFEKEIYRLCLLGIADDWTRDFKDSFTVKFNSTDSQHIVESLKSYVRKYDPREDVESNINAITQSDCNSTLKKAVWYLLDWIFRNITESRKQALKTLSDWCLDYKDSDSFKRRIEAFFTITESTYVLQHIAEHPSDYFQWFAPFYWVDNEGKKTDIFISESEVMILKDRLSRLLEGYHRNPGLDFISGMIRLILNDFDDPDGRRRMESALKAITEDNADNLIYNGFSTRIVQFLKDAKLNEEQLNEICMMIIKYIPPLLETLVEQLEIPWLYNDMIQRNIETLRNLNISLYEQIGRIQ